MIYSERSWKMEHFLFLRHVLNRRSFRDNCVWSWRFFKFCVLQRKLSSFRCNTQISKIANFRLDYLGNDNDSEVTVKTKNAPFFMNFSNTCKLWQFWFKTWFRIFVVVHKISKIANFTHNSLENYNDSEHAVKQKNALFFMNFPNL